MKMAGDYFSGINNSGIVFTERILLSLTSDRCRNYDNIILLLFIVILNSITIKLLFYSNTKQNTDVQFVVQNKIKQKTLFCAYLS